MKVQSSFLRKTGAGCRPFQNKASFPDTVEYHLDEFLRKALFIKNKFSALDRFCRLAAYKSAPRNQHDGSFHGIDPSISYWRI